MRVVEAWPSEEPCHRCVIMVYSDAKLLTLSALLYPEKPLQMLRITPDELTFQPRRGRGGEALFLLSGRLGKVQAVIKWATSTIRRDRRFALMVSFQQSLFISDNFLRLKIYYGELNYEVIAEELAYTVSIQQKKFCVFIYSWRLILN